MENRYPSSIRSKLILLGALAFLPVVLLTVFNSWHLRKLEVAEARERVSKILDFAILHEEEAIRDTHWILSVLAEVPNLREGGKPASEFLARLLVNSPEYTNFVVCRPDGQVVASAVPLTTEINFSDRPYFQDVLKSKSFSIGQYTVGRITGKPIIVFGYPVIDRRGNVTSVLLAPLDLSRVTRFETEMDVQTPRNSTYVKLDGNGAVLTSHPESQMFGRGYPLEKPLFEKISREKKGTFQAVGVDGVERLYLFSSFRDPFNKNEGYALLGIPTKELFTEVNRILVFELAVLAVIGILFLAVVWIGGDSLIVRPVGALVDATKRLAEGDLTARSGLVSKEGEIGQLSRAFDEMAEKLERGDHESRKMQAQLLQATKMEAVGRLAGGVAHDFNNLLTVIMGYSELLLQKVGKESSMHGEVKEIQRAGERA
ncbi:MAG TPA: HAMP domain-containing protein, partial [Candidatus Binatia bacterium]|nr:HAMP domain-containing protein [Candidatus Binatia bacterium]